MKRKIILLISMLLVLAGLSGCKNNNPASSEHTTASNAEQTNTGISTVEDTREETEAFVLPEIDPVSYTTLTGGNYTKEPYGSSFDRMEAGSTIEAYPLNFTDTFNNVLIDGTGFGLSHFISDRYDREWVSFSGYFLQEENGYTTLRESMDTEGTPRIIIQEVVESIGLMNGDNIRMENGWAAEHGDFITVVGRYSGYYNNEYGNFMILNNVFLAEES